MKLVINNWEIDEVSYNKEDSLLSIYATNNSSPSDRRSTCMKLDMKCRNNPHGILGIVINWALELKEW